MLEIYNVVSEIHDNGNLVLGVKIDPNRAVVILESRLLEYHKIQQGFLQKLSEYYHFESAICEENDGFRNQLWEETSMSGDPYTFISKLFISLHFS